MNGDYAEILLDSYGAELSPKWKSILHNQFSKLIKRGRYTEAQIHEYVTDFVDNRVIKPGHALLSDPVSLDDSPHPEYEKSKNTINTNHRLFSVEDAGIREIFTRVDLDAENAADVLRSELDDVSYKFLAALAQHGNDFNTGLTADELHTKLPKNFKEKLAKIASVFYINDRLVIPRYSKILSYDPLTIQVGRLPEETVKRIYEAHERRMTLEQARKFSGVSMYTVSEYWTRAGLTVHKDFKNSGKITKTLLNCHKKGLSIAQTSKIVKLSSSSVRSRWKKLGLPIIINRTEQRKLSDKDIEEIKRSYETYKGSASKAAQNLPWGTHTIIKYWRSMGLDIKKRGRVNAETEELIYEGHRRGLSGETTADFAGVSFLTVYKYWHAAGLSAGRDRTNTESRQDGRSLRSDEIEEIKRSHKTYSGNSAEAARNIPYSSPTIRKYWKLNNLT